MSENAENRHTENIHVLRIPILRIREKDRQRASRARRAPWESPRRAPQKRRRAQAAHGGPAEPLFPASRKRPPGAAWGSRARLAPRAKGLGGDLDA